MLNTDMPEGRQDMQKASQMLLLAITFLMPALVLADDARAPVAALYQSDVAALSSQPYGPEYSYASRWHLVPPSGTGPYADDPFQPIASLDFRDPGTLARVSKVRELSLLTLAEVGKARFFFGVSNSGLFGLHLGALPRLGDERCVELARMPYLKNAARDGR